MILQDVIRLAMGKLTRKRYQSMLSILESNNNTYALYVEILVLKYRAINDPNYENNGIRVIMYNPDYGISPNSHHYYVLEGSQNDR